MGCVPQGLLESDLPKGLARKWVRWALILWSALVEDFCFCVFWGGSRR